MAREVLVAGDGVSGARKGQSVEALPEDREVVVEEILERPVLGRRLVVRRWEPERVVQRRLAGLVREVRVTIYVPAVTVPPDSGKYSV